MPGYGHTPYRRHVRLLPLILLLTLVARAEEFTDKLSKTFPLKPGNTLTLDADFGFVEVRTSGSGAQVQVEVFRRVTADSKEEAQKIFDDLVLESRPDKEGTLVLSRFQKGWQKREEDGNRWRNTICESRSSELEPYDWDRRDSREHGDDGNVYCLSYGRQIREYRYVVTLPRNQNLRVRTRAGHIEISDVDGYVKARTAGGHITAGVVKGEADLRTAGGHIEITSSGGPAHLTTAGGHITVGDVNGDLWATTAGGHIHSGKVKGSVTAKTAGGSIEIAQASGYVKAETVGGSVTVRFASQPTADSSLKTMAGSVRVELPKNVKLDLDARSAGGSVSTDYSVETASYRGRESLQGKINGGGPRLELRSSFGSIRVSQTSYPF